MSGKGFNKSLFGLLDGEKESKNADVFKRIVEDMKVTKDAGKSLGKEYLNLTKSGQEFTRELVHSKKPLNETMQGFTAASQSASKLTLASKAATLGMKALSFAMNVGIMLAVSGAINFVVEKLGEAKKASEDAAVAIGGSNYALIHFASLLFFISNFL